MEAATWQILNTQLVVSYMGDSGSCSDDCGGHNKKEHVEHIACGKLHG